MDGSWIRGQCIGKGSCGAVNLAVERSTGRFFAVKSVRLDSAPLHAVAALENEIRLLRSFDSPHIVSYLGDDFTVEPFSGEASRNLHLEYLSGGTLADAAASGKICERRVRAYARSIALALHYLHSSAGVVHGDVKGRNVLLGSSAGVTKLADFGSARRILCEEGGSSVQGTPLWMAPEVARGESPAPASDVWSLGCTVIEMAGGVQSPWGNSWAGAAIEMRRIGFTDAVPEFPVSLSDTGRDFLSKCLAREPGKRWSCNELLRHPFLADAPAITEPSPRSVLDLEEVESDFDSTPASVWRRIRDLETSAPENWDGAGWLTVRTSVAEQQEQAVSGECLDGGGGEREEGEAGLRETSGAGVSGEGEKCGGHFCAGCCMRMRDAVFLLIACSQMLFDTSHVLLLLLRRHFLSSSSSSHCLLPPSQSFSAPCDLFVEFLFFKNTFFPYKKFK